ncbi:MAG: chemotaxis protein CheW [Halanaerobium sp.]|nr:chemotaxis protein CheW [Halanaerobium sp.]
MYHNKDEVQVKQKKLIGFRLAENLFGLEILQVKEIIPLPEITELPNTDKWIKGIINLRGNIVSVVDMREQFSYPVEITKETKVIIVEKENKLVGLIVDEVVGVISMADSSIDERIKNIDAIEKKYIKALGKLEDELMIILDVDTLLTYEKEERNIINSQLQ